MGMNAGGGDGEPMLEINTTPLIDVMLVLLMMFIITLPALTHAVKLDLPRGHGSQSTTQPITVEVDFDGSIILNGSQVPLANFEDYCRTEARRVPQPALHVRPNRRADYDAVAKVLAIARRNGMQHIGFVGNEQFMN